MDDTGYTLSKIFNIRRSRYIDRYRVIHRGNRKEGDSSAEESIGDVE